MFDHVESLHMSAAEHLASKPLHVADAAVHDFDIFLDPELLRDPHARIIEVARNAPPIFWTPRNGGHWLVTCYEDAFRVLREPETFSSSATPLERRAAQAALPPGARRTPEITPILMDPPLHTKYRAPLLKVFAPKTVMALKGDIEALAVSLVDAVVDAGHCDFIPAVAEQLPVRVFLKMMGLSAERLVEFRALVREVLAPAGSDPLVQSRRIRNVADAMLDVILARRTDPRDDLISRLWALEIDDEPMTLELMEDYCALLFIAGLDTVINGIGFGMRHLAQNPTLQRELRANPKLIPEAAEELLRRYTFTVPVRRATRDTTLGEWTIRAGDLMIVYLPAVDLDASQFSAPLEFDVARENKTHMAFGAGPHRCLGSHLARIELQTLYTVVFERMPVFRLDPDRPARFHAGNILAVASLPLRWD